MDIFGGAEQKELAKQKLDKMMAYKEQVRELYKPKTSVKLQLELEMSVKAGKHQPRGPSTSRDYLAQLRFKKNLDSQLANDEGSKLSGVASLPSLQKRDLKSE